MKASPGSGRREVLAPARPGSEQGGKKCFRKQVHVLLKVNLLAWRNGSVFAEKESSSGLVSFPFSGLCFCTRASGLRLGKSTPHRMIPKATLGHLLGDNAGGGGGASESGEMLALSGDHSSEGGSQHSRKWMQRLAGEGTVMPGRKQGAVPWGYVFSSFPLGVRNPQN